MCEKTFMGNVALLGLLTYLLFCWLTGEEIAGTFSLVEISSAELFHTVLSADRVAVRSFQLPSLGFKKKFCLTFFQVWSEIFSSVF